MNSKSPGLCNRDKLSACKDKSPDALRLALGIVPDYRENVPALQFPMPAEPGQVHPIGLIFSSALVPDSVTNDTVLLKLDGVPDALDATVDVVGGNKIVLTPTQRISDAGGLVHIIVTPDVKMADGRAFAGFHVRSPSG
jgi:hypothetical protein